MLHPPSLDAARPERPRVPCAAQVVGELKEWAHSHLAACLLDEFNASSTPSGTWCKPSDRANSVEGHTIILEMAIHIVPADKRDPNPNPNRASARPC